jgi:hypothetical protein
MRFVPLDGITVRELKRRTRAPMKKCAMVDVAGRVVGFNRLRTECVGLSFQALRP